MQLNEDPNKSKELVMLSYTFMFYKGETPWDYLNEFESDLAKFFEVEGMRARIVKTIAGQEGQRILLLEKMPPTILEPEPPPTPIGEKLNQMNEKPKKLPKKK